MKTKTLIGMILLISTAIIGCSKSTIQNTTTPKVDTTHPLDKGLPPNDYSYPSHAFDLTQALPEGHVTDGSVTYTAHLQAALDNHKVVVLPNFPIQIDKPGLRIRDNAEVYFREKSQLKMAANPHSHYYMILLLDAENVLIKNANLEGDRNRHLGTTGEWGMGMYISGCKDIFINAATIKNCWGDGIYLGQDSWNKPSDNILIEHAFIDSNRRAGIAIISATNVTINECIVQNTNGPFISSAITMEANNRNNDINNIVINNCITKNNAKVGIRIASSNLIGSHGELKESKITISNYKDFGSQFGISFVLGNNKNKGGMKESEVLLMNCILEDNTGHAIVDYTEANANVYQDVYMKDISPITNKEINEAQVTRIDNLTRSTDYFHYLD